jgi:hypothetical protein
MKCVLLTVFLFSDEADGTNFCTFWRIGGANMKNLFNHYFVNIKTGIWKNCHISMCITYAHMNIQ